VILPDVNVLIYAYRKDQPHHAASRTWLERTVEGQSAIGLSRLVLSAVVRLMSNPRIYHPPETLDDVFAYCNWLIGRPSAVLVEPGERHWGIFERLCRETGTRGARVSDAWLAALAIEHGCEWVTFDRDYARFPGLKWSVPGASSR
jgi:hypothetical protein